MLIGYARVSTHEQNLDLQRDELKQAGCERILVDELSGINVDRPGFKMAMEVLRKGDILVVWRLDRLGRSLANLLEIVKELSNREIGFKSLKEVIDTSSPTGTLIFHIFGALAEFERNLIRERTLAGLTSARARGRMGGRPNALDHYKMEIALRLYQEGKHTGEEIAEIMDISRGTLYNYIKKHASLR